jgi:serine/threonine protein kinase
MPGMKLLNKISKLIETCKSDSKTKELCKMNKYTLAKNILSSSDYNIDRIDEQSYPKILQSLVSIEKSGEGEPSFIKNTRSKSDYKILSILGCGAQGCVYFAHDTNANRNVIIKSGKDLLNEKRILKILNKYSKKFPIYLGSFKDNDTSYIVTKPFLGGEGTNLPSADLSKLLTTKKLTLTEMKHLYLNILQSVYEMNKLGVKHKDLKPQNILVNDNLEVQIIDFGVACYKTDKRCVYGFSRKYQPSNYTGSNLDYSEINDMYSVVQILGDILGDALRDTVVGDASRDTVVGDALRDTVGDSFDEKLTYLKTHNLNLRSIHKLLREYCVSQDCMNFIYLDELIKLIQSVN